MMDSTAGAIETPPAFPAKGSLEKVTLCFGPAADFVLKLISRNLRPSDRILILPYEDFSRRWFFRMRDGELHFCVNGRWVEPICLYVRGAVVEPEDPHWEPVSGLLSLFNAWNGKVICRPNTQWANESKLYQMMTSLAPAAAACGGNPVSAPASYVLKSPAIDLQALVQREGSLIAKSLSGVRSLVCSDREFMRWQMAGLNHLPTLFQRRIEGADARVHTLGHEAWGLKVQEKSEVDYRYAANRSEMVPVEIPALVRRFCDEVRALEGTDLVGFDFLLSPEGWVPLEANPGPGWAWYHERERCETSFIDAFLSKLRDATI